MSDVEKPNFKKTNRSQQIADYIRVQILNKERKQGDQIDDKELSESLNVSRNSVREALAQLKALGIIEQPHWKGYYVVKLNSQDITEILDSRKMLELAAFESFIQIFSASKESEQNNIIHEMEKSVRDSQLYYEQNNETLFLESDDKIYKIIQHYANNRLINRLIQQVSFFWDLLRHEYKGRLFTLSAINSIEDHFILIRLLREKQYNKATLLLGRHLDRQRSYFNEVQK